MKIHKVCNLKPTFEETFLDMQSRKLELENQRVSIENRVSLMRHAKSLVEKGLTRNQILVIFPQAEGVLEDDCVN